ncbi:response regulator [Plantibacter sp. YIM 135249]|uniref:response regulator n=1 Tax=Plantibacter sp. YIM 135249 TaxID=3423918 RepID=UPI003D328AF4
MSAATDLRVLVVDDDFHVARLHREVIDSVAGFTALPSVGSAAAAVEAVVGLRPDLVLLDVFLPDRSGLDLLRELDVDTVVVSAATDGSTIRRALRSGALGYLVKPFPAALLTDRLGAYARFRNILAAEASHDQESVERALRVLHSGDARGVARSRSATEQSVLDAVTLASGELSAVDVAELVGVSRATAQRYLAGLAANGLVRVQLRYGTAGRPEHRYAPVD